MTEFICANIPVAHFGSDGLGVEDALAANAAYLSWIAYPRRQDTDRAKRFVNAVRAHHYKASGRHAPTELRNVRPSKMNGTVADAMDSIRQRRWPAREMAGRILSLDNMDSMSARLRTVTTQITDEGDVLDGAEPHNVKARVWDESLPALAMILATPHPPDGDRSWWLQNPDWLLGAVSVASELAPFLAQKFDAPFMFVPRLIAVQAE